MKKIRLFIIIAMFILSSGCRLESQQLNPDAIVIKNLNGVDESNINKYKIDVELDTETMTYTGKQTLTYTNNTDIDLEELYFHLYPNAFGNLYDSPLLFNSREKIGSLNDMRGFIDIEKVSFENKDLELNILDTILHVKLNETLRKGKSTEIYLEYKVTLPAAKDRFGYHDKGINFGNWYPIVCVYDEKGWNLDPYYKIGDPFYSQVSDYDVTITVPKEMVVASSGRILSEKKSKGKKIYNIEGKLIRDFAWVASKDFVVKEKKVDDTIVKVYSVNDDSHMIDKTLEIGEQSLLTFNRIFGKYPYAIYSIVNTEFPSGMEYPGIVFISNDYFYRDLTSILEKVIVHETAHQWWYGLVGNNQVTEAWLDESLATYSELIYVNETKGEREAKDYYNENIKLGYEYATQYKYIGNEVVNKPLEEFAGWDDYSILVYLRGAMFIDRIKEDFGEEVLYEILSKYYERYKFHIATTEDFIKVCEEVTNTSFEPLVKEYLNGNK
jgi:hypothetical protein